MKNVNGNKEYKERIPHDFKDRYTLVATELECDLYEEERNLFDEIINQYRPQLVGKAYIHGTIIKNAIKKYMKSISLDYYSVYRILANYSFHTDLHGNRSYELWINNDYLDRFRNGR